MSTSMQRKLALTLLLAGAVAVNPAMADKPDWAGKGKPDKEARDGRQGNRHGDDDRRDKRDGRGEERANYFDDRHRVVVRDYYAESFRSGHCPRGLAKKNNGCLPPGQARKWKKGQPLPSGLAYYDLPPQVVVHLGPPPAGHKFVRVAGDILLIAIGTSMVIDAIEDLSR